jgi:hypothetical protein
VTAPQSSGDGAIEGVVVRLGTNEPIVGVHVELRRVEGTAALPLGPLVFPSGYFSPGALVRRVDPNPSDSASARTTEGGRFTFGNLKPGKYRLLAADPRGIYYALEYGQRNPRGGGVDIPLEGQRLSVRLEMVPMSSVSGRVIGADGKPAAHVHVMAAEIAYQNGERVLNQVQGVETNDRGDYRLFWLPPGRYYIGAFPEGMRRREYATPFGPPAQVESLNQTFSQALVQYRAGPNGEVLEEVYETVYAPGDTNLQSARIIDLRSGSNAASIDISLAAGRRAAARIRGLVVDGVSGRPAPGARVIAAPRSAGPAVFSPTATTDASGRFEIVGVMAGSYLLRATLDPNRNANGVLQHAVQSVDIGGSGVDGLKLLLTSGLRIDGRVTLDDGAASNDYRVSLTPDVSQIPFPGGGEPSGGAFSLSGVYPGSYRVVVSPRVDGAERAFVKSVKFGGAELPDHEFRLGDSVPGELEILIGRNGGSLEGNVIDAQRSAAVNVMVALVPVGSRRADRSKTVRTDSTGRFRLQGLPPGNYLAIAFPWIERGLAQYSEFSRAIENRATAVSINEGTNRNIDLTLQPELDF